MRPCNPSSTYSLALVFGVALLLRAAAVQAAAAPIPHGTLELIAENQWITAGHTLNLGLHFQLEGLAHLLGQSRRFGPAAPPEVAFADGSHPWGNGVAYPEASRHV